MSLKRIYYNTHFKTARTARVRGINCNTKQTERSQRLAIAN